MKIFRGKVVTGDGVAGRDLGTPTANLDLSKVDLEPGVYAAEAYLQGEKHDSIVCYGIGEPPKFEVHLFNFDEDIIGEELEVEIVEQVGELVPWSSVERMRQKILHDIELAGEVLKKRKKNQE